MQVRTAALVDAQSIAEIHVTSSQETYRGMIPDERLADLSVDERRSVWEEILGESPAPSQVVMIVEEAAPLGFVHVCQSRDKDAMPTTGEVASIYVAPESWGTGAGKLLMVSAVDWLRQHDFVSATLWTLIDNLRAQRFYEAGGWRADGVEKRNERGRSTLIETRYRLDL